MASILEMFRGLTPGATPAQAQAAAPVAPTQPFNATVQQGADAAAQNAVPGNPMAPAASPLDAYKDLWQPAETDGTQQSFNLDSAKVMEAAQKANFAAGVNPELVQNALKGDVNAFLQVVNSVGQQAFAQATIASSKINEQQLQQFGTKQEAMIPGLVKRNLVSNTLQENPLYKHEATRPLLSALEAQIASKFPNATANQITEHAQQFIAEFAKVAASNQPQTAEQQQQQQRQQQNDFDWNSFT